MLIDKQELLDMGAKYIVVQGAPPTGCLPLAMILTALDDRDDIGCSASANNRTLHTNSMRMIMKNTRKYGFTEPYKACCGAGGPPYNFEITSTCGSQGASKACPHPAKYINWDGVHLTEGMYKVVADLFLHGGYTHPPFDYLLSSRRRDC